MAATLDYIRTKYSVHSRYTEYTVVGVGGDYDQGRLTHTLLAIDLHSSKDHSLSCVASSESKHHRDGKGRLVAGCSHFPATNGRIES